MGSVYPSSIFGVNVVPCIHEGSVGRENTFTILASGMGVTEEVTRSRSIWQNNINPVAINLDAQPVVSSLCWGIVW